MLTAGQRSAAEFAWRAVTDHAARIAGQRLREIVADGTPLTAELMERAFQAGVSAPWHAGKLDAHGSDGSEFTVEVLSADARVSDGLDASTITFTASLVASDHDDGDAQMWRAEWEWMRCEDRPNPTQGEER